MRARLRVACALGACAAGLSGCERLLSIHDPVAGDGSIGGDDAAIDAGPPAASPILLSEVVMTPDPGEMIEIVNTSNQDVELSDYYLSDSGNYYKTPFDPAVDMTDFIVKFPAGAVIRAHQAIAIAVDTPTNFLDTYTVLPTYSLRDGSMTTIAMNGAPNVTNGGEPIFLFRWDGRSDLVSDVDLLLAGAPSGATNAFPNKSNVTQDGPDAGAEPSKYAVDLHTIVGQPGAPGSGLSTKRIALEDNRETQDGNGNGPSGHDETSENTALTWDGTASAPFTAPTPGTVPPALLR